MTVFTARANASPRTFAHGPHVSLRLVLFVAAAVVVLAGGAALREEQLRLIPTPPAAGSAWRDQTDSAGTSLGLGGKKSALSSAWAVCRIPRAIFQPGPRPLRPPAPPGPSLDGKRAMPTRPSASSAIERNCPAAVWASNRAPTRSSRASAAVWMRRCSKPTTQRNRPLPARRRLPPTAGGPLAGWRCAFPAAELGADRAGEGRLRRSPATSGR